MQSDRKVITVEEGRAGETDTLTKQGTNSEEEDLDSEEEKDIGDEFLTVLPSNLDCKWSHSAILLRVPLKRNHRFRNPS